MAQLVKIKNIHLYIGITSNVDVCISIQKILEENKIPFTLLNYSDQTEHHKLTFEALSTWPLGPNGDRKAITDFPILVWDECFDDWTSYRRIAQGLSEITDSDVLKYPDLT